MPDEGRRPEVIETTVSEVAAELARRGLDAHDRITITIEPDELIPGRREARARVIAAGLTLRPSLVSGPGRRARRRARSRWAAASARRNRRLRHKMPASSSTRCSSVGPCGKQRHTAKRIFERLRDEHGYAGGITIVKDYVLAHRLRHREVFVPLRHDPGHAQVDFGEALAEIAGLGRQDPLFRDGPAAQRCLLCAGLSGGDRRSVLRRAQCRVRVFWHGAEVHPV